MTIDATCAPVHIHAPAGSANRRFTGAPGCTLPAPLALPEACALWGFRRARLVAGALGNACVPSASSRAGFELTWRQIERFREMEAGRRAEDVERLMGALIRRRR